MWAGKVSSRLGSRNRTSIITLFAMLASRTQLSSAACGLPSNMELDGPAPAEHSTASSQKGALHVIASGRNESFIGLSSIPRKIPSCRLTSSDDAR